MVRPLPTATFEVTVDEELVAAFHRDGFCQLPRITTDEELVWIGEVFDEFFIERRGGIPGGYFDLARPYDADGEDRLPQVLFPEQQVPELRDSVFQRNARRVIARLLDVDEDELHAWGHMIRKPARHGHEIPWHQDEAYWEPDHEYLAVGAWMPLDDVDLRNGCMCFLPGSHRLDVVPHRHIGDDPSVHGLEIAVEIDTSAMVPVPLPAGGATFHHPRTLHHTPPNATDRERRAFATEFQTTPTRRPVPAERPWLDEGKEAWARRSPSKLR